jgi:hypothetical protein
MSTVVIRGLGIAICRDLVKTIDDSLLEQIRLGSAGRYQRLQAGLTE